MTNKLVKYHLFITLKTYKEHKVLDIDKQIIVVFLVIVNSNFGNK